MAQVDDHPHQPDAVRSAADLDRDPRERIVDALFKNVSEHGYAKSRIQDVARDARVSLRTFYQEFGNKEECFLELHARLNVQMSTFLRAEAAPLDESLSWRETMRRGFETYYTLLAANQRMTHAMLVELQTLGDDARRAREGANQESADVLAELVERDRARFPEIPSRPLSPLLARSVIGSVMELVTSYAVRGKLDDVEDLVDTTTDLLWSLVTRPGGGGSDASDMHPPVARSS